ncbi:MAG: hypothetical protein LC122_11960 [Chitinophagales bacterium]|nr:hypothetical protein [Chitinophagales bacterium]
MSPPLEGYEHVVISSAVVPFTGPETYIFPCDNDGKIISWGELEGSQRGTLDYSVVLADLGYEEVLNDKEEY